MSPDKSEGVYTKDEMIAIIDLSLGRFEKLLDERGERGGLTADDVVTVMQRAIQEAEGCYERCVKMCKGELSGPDLTECIKGCASACQGQGFFPGRWVIRDRLTLV